MSHESEISYGTGQKCSLELDSSRAEPAGDPELTISRHAVHGIAQGELSLLVTRTQAPAIVKVTAEERGTGLPPEQIEQIRRSAEGILRAQAE